MKKFLKNQYVCYTLLFLCISVFVFLSFILEGKTFIWKEDGIWQHFLILYDYNDFIRNIFHHFSTFSFPIGLGQDMIGQYAYYVIGDPFVYLTMLFPMDKMEFAYNFIIYLKFYAIGLSFLYYTNYQKMDKTNSVIGALLYTFCGFSLYAGVRHLSFLNPVILFPLLLVGVEKLIKENKMSFLICIASISIVVNYYFFVTISILAVIYAVVELICDIGIKEYKVILHKVLKAFLCYVIAILIAGVILYPTLYTFLNCARIGGYRFIFYPPSYYKNLFIGFITNASVGSRYWSIFGMSSIVLLVVPLLFKNYKKDKKLFSLFLIFCMMLLIPLCGQIMNGFSYPVNRWSFGYCFVLSILVVQYLNKDLTYSKIEKRIMFYSLSIYLILGLILSKCNKEFLLMISFAVIIYFLIVYKEKLMKYKVFKKIKPIYFVYLLICFNLTLFSNSLYSSYGKNYIDQFIDKKDAINTIKTNNHSLPHLEDVVNVIKEDKGFYRSVIYPSSMPNIGAFYNINTLNSYVSLSTKEEQNLAIDLNNSSYSSNRYIKDFDNRTKITTRLANKYYILSKENQNKVPFGYKKINEIGNTILYKNEYAIPMLIYSNDFITPDEYEKLSDLDKEQILLDTVVTDTNNSIKHADSAIKNLNNNKKKIDYVVRKNSPLKIENHKIKVRSKKDKLILELNGIKNSEIYLSFSNIYKEVKNTKQNQILKKLSQKNTNNLYKFQVNVSRSGYRNNEERRAYFSNMYYFENRDFLMNLGYENDWSGKIEISFSELGTYHFDDLEIYAVDMNNYVRSIKQMQSANITSFSDNEIYANFDVKEKGIMSLSTSYSKGWKVYIDDKKVDTIKVNNSMLGFYINEGKHTIKIKYHTPYLTIGLLSSILGVGILIIIVLKEKKR